jgi:hypothetical protein
MRTYPLYLFLFILGTLHFSNLSAQKVEAALYLGKKEPKPTWFEYSPKDKGLVTLGQLSRTSSRYIGIFKYDQQFSRQWQKTLFEQNGRLAVDHLAVLGDNIVVFVSEDFPKEEQVVVWAYQYDLKGNLLKNRIEVNRGPRQKKERMTLNYTLSPNKKQLLCFQKVSKKGENEKLKFFVFDEKFRAPVEGGLEIPWTSDKFDLRAIRVGNNGEVFILGRVDQGLNTAADNWLHYMYRYDPNLKDAIEIKLDFQDNFVTDLNFRTDRENNILIAGYYSRRAPGSIAGVFYQRIDGITNKAVVETYHPFDEAFMGKYLSQRQLEKGKELNNFFLDKIIPRSDGGVLILGEQYYVTVNTYRDIYGYWFNQTFYHYDDVLVTSISGDGKMEWTSVVYKRQMSENSSQLSYFDVVSTDRLFLFYEYREKDAGPNVYYQTIDFDGQVSARKPMFPEYKAADVFYRSFCEQVNNQEAILVYFQQRRKVFSLIKLSF